MSTEVKYSLKKKFMEVPIEQEDETVVVYEIRRCSGAEIEAYLDENSSRIKTGMSEDGKVRIDHITTYKGMFVSLLKRCLYKNNVLVPVSEISNFPHEVQKGLFNDAQTINGLNEEGVKEAKN